MKQDQNQNEDPISNLEKMSRLESVLLKIGKLFTLSPKHPIIHRVKNFLEFLSMVRLKQKIEREFNQIVRPGDRLPPPFLWGAILSKNPIDKFFEEFNYFISYYTLAQKFKPIFEKYDIIQAYGTDPILVYLSGVNRPLVSFEHATMRRLPLENFILGKILALAYKHSDRCLITNLDCTETAKKLGLDNYEFIQHPVDTNKFSPRQVELRNEILKRFGVDYIFFAPARHNWKEKGTDRIIYGFAEFVKKSDKKAVMVFSRWGPDQDESKKLISELGIEDYVHWEMPMPKMRLAEFFNASDVVLDQFVEYGVFGTIVIEAMACGKPVIMHLAKEKISWALEEPPVVVNAFSPEEIASSLSLLSNNHQEAERIGKEAREWVEKYHSSDLVVDKLVKIYDSIIAK